MDKEFSSFRKSTFGFNRRDVINYIEKMRNESYEYKKQVEETVKSLNEKIRELENAARLMENSAAVQETEAVAEMPSEYLGDIGQATKHLKAVADELCKSLGDFMDKLSEKGLFDKAVAAEADATVSENEMLSFVDSILASISYLGDGESAVKAEPEKKIAEAYSVSDILAGYSFIK